VVTGLVSADSASQATMMIDSRTATLIASALDTTGWCPGGDPIPVIGAM
jgi:hypothetical protein